MTRENVLFAVIGVLFGYIVGFTFVIHYNQSPQAQASAQAAGASQLDGELPADHPPVAANAVKDRQSLRKTAQEAEKAARAAPNDFDAQLSAAGAWAQADDYEQAIDFLTRANQLRPGDYDTLVRLGNANFEARRYEVAGQWYTQALAKKPEDVNVRSDLGLTYFLREPSQPDKAIAEFRRALERQPEHAPSLHNLTLVLIKTGDLAEAERTLARLEKANPQAEDLPRLREELEKARQEGGKGGKQS